jgi:hypothetical protein
MRLEKIAWRGFVLPTALLLINWRSTTLIASGCRSVTRYALGSSNL